MSDSFQRRADFLQHGPAWNIRGQLVDSLERAQAIHDVNHVAALELDRPFAFDVTRHPNPHLAFGIGPHFCLGANLARMEVKLVFQELLNRFPDMKIDDDAPLRRGESSLVIALQHLPATFTAGGCPVLH